MALNLGFGLIEVLFGYTAGAVMAILCLRLAITLSLTMFSWLTLDKKFHRNMDPLALGFYTVRNLFLGGEGRQFLPYMRTWLMFRFQSPYVGGP